MAQIQIQALHIMEGNSRVQYFGLSLMQFNMDENFLQFIIQIVW